MKLYRSLVALAGIAFLAMSITVPALAGVDDRTYSLQTTGAGTSSTNAKRYAVHGFVEAVHVDVPTSATGAVLIISADGQTILSIAAATADAVYYPRTPGHFANTTGNGNGINTNLVRFPVSGIVTGRVIGASFQTNTYKLRLITSD